jgi:hypothetical protein
VDGTASLADTDFGRFLRANQQKVIFSVPPNLQMTPQSRAISTS